MKSKALFIFLATLCLGFLPSARADEIDSPLSPEATMYFACFAGYWQNTILFDYQEEFVGSVDRSRWRQPFRQHTTYSKPGKENLAEGYQLWSTKSESMPGKHQLRVVNKKKDILADLMQTQWNKDRAVFLIVGSDAAESLTAYVDRKTLSIQFVKSNDQERPVANLTYMNSGFRKHGWLFEKLATEDTISSEAWPVIVSFLIGEINPHYRSNLADQCSLYEIILQASINSASRH